MLLRKVDGVAENRMPAVNNNTHIRALQPKKLRKRYVFVVTNVTATATTTITS